MTTTEQLSVPPKSMHHEDQASNNAKPGDMTSDNQKTREQEELKHKESDLRVFKALAIKASESPEPCQGYITNRSGLAHAWTSPVLS
ncbi:hypothetical protein SAMD00023353_13200060 [Rosellinia necatrix]|uniref:Uncharacterized protein n=1 Tax=Rosellinia necatrix TaxID=77044 RepID=A0A1S8ABC1_ROSNE|nr:hypothetical protein SAMD00023353_13200060 [Rosellinia necatrix]